MALSALPDRGSFQPGRYLTDGRSLYRVVAPFEALGVSRVAELEDCLTLETRLYGASELWRMGLRGVNATAGADQDQVAAAAAA